MLRGLWKLTWLETKIFMREPLGALGTILIPVADLRRLRAPGGRPPRFEQRRRPRNIVRTDLPVFAAMMIAISAVLSLVTIVSIYREGGILKRLRATPLRPQAILSAHVLVKLMLSARDASADGAGRQALLPGDARCAGDRVHGCPADQHREHSRRSGS